MSRLTSPCGAQHRQLAKWLRELQVARKELNRLRQTFLAGVMHVAGSKKRHLIHPPRTIGETQMSTVFGPATEGDL